MKNYLLAILSAFFLYSCGKTAHGPSDNRIVANTESEKETDLKIERKKAVSEIFLLMNTDKYNKKELQEIVSTEMPKIVDAIESHMNKKKSLNLTGGIINGIWKNGEWKPKAGARSKTTYYRPSDFRRNRELDPIPEIEPKKRPESPILQSDSDLSVSVINDKENLPFGTEQVAYNNSWGITIEILE
ncbi:MAG: hypothetical protein AB8G05_22140 [Oligoflexales bacterium]